MRELQRRVVFGIAAGLVGFAAAMLALGFVSLALFFGLAPLMSAAWAAALTAVIVLVAAALLIAILRLAGANRPAPLARPAVPPGDIAAEIGTLLGQRARGFAGQHTGATILGSLALGFVIGMSPALRDFLRRGL
jgi:hypothetical protein